MAKLLGDQIGIVEFVALDVADGLEADGERFKIFLAEFGEQGDQKRAVETSGQQHADRHVGDAAAIDSFAERGTHCLAPFGFGQWRDPPARGPTSSRQ